MSNANNSCIPRLRFPGFEGEWEEKSFGELYEKHNVKNDLSFGVDKIISVANMYYKGDAAVSDDEYLKTYNIFRLGDIAYEGNKSANYAYGRFVENTIGDGIVSHVFDVYSPISSDHNLDYWKYAINYERIMRPILEKSTIKSTMMTNLIAKDFLKQKILVPPSLSEQQRIASCLSELDNLIAAQDQKVDALKEKKKGLMQQLFPQPGETKPRLRFPGFEGEWVEKKLGDLIEESRESSINENEDILLTSSIDGMYLNSEVFSHQRGSSTIGYRKIKKGMLILSAQNLHLGNANVNLRFDSGLVSPAYKVYYIVGCLPQYLAQWIKREETKRFFFNATTQGASECRRNVVWEQLYKQVLSIPSQAEQQKIASCLSSLDDLIATESAKVEALKDHKKGLMQQLFPQPTK